MTFLGSIRKLRPQGKLPPPSWEGQGEFQQPQRPAHLERQLLSHQPAKRSHDGFGALLAAEWLLEFKRRGRTPQGPVSGPGHHEIYFYQVLTLKIQEMTPHVSGRGRRKVIIFEICPGFLSVAKNYSPRGNTL